MIRLEEGLLAGTLSSSGVSILVPLQLRRPIPSILSTSTASLPAHMEKLLAEGYVYLESAFDSLDHITSTAKKNILKAEGVTGLSKMKAADLDTALKDHLTEEN